MTRGCRLTVRVSAVHEDMASGRSVPAVCAGDGWLKGAEQPWVRHLSAGPEWKPLERGWLGAASLLVVEVHSGGPVEVGLMLGEPRAARRDMWPELRQGVPPAGPTPCWVARPGRPLLAEPADPSLLWLRCPEGEAGLTVHLFPA